MLTFSDNCSGRWRPEGVGTGIDTGQLTPKPEHMMLVESLEFFVPGALKVKLDEFELLKKESIFRETYRETIVTPGTL
jgi:hypothetical protein